MQLILAKTSLIKHAKYSYVLVNLTKKGHLNHNHGIPGILQRRAYVGYRYKPRSVRASTKCNDLFKRNRGSPAVGILHRATDLRSRSSSSSHHHGYLEKLEISLVGDPPPPQFDARLSTLKSTVVPTTNRRLASIRHAGRAAEPRALPGAAIPVMSALFVRLYYFPHRSSPKNLLIFRGGALIYPVLPTRIKTLLGF